MNTPRPTQPLEPVTLGFNRPTANALGVSFVVGAAMYAGQAAAYRVGAYARTIKAERARRKAEVPATKGAPLKAPGDE